MFSKFLLGKLTVDDDARQVLQRTPLDLIARHAVCDFGEITPRRLKQNLLALEEGDEIQSEYLVDPSDREGERVRITTSAGWGETHVTLIKKQPRRKKANDVPF